eukprot:242033_1
MYNIYSDNGILPTTPTIEGKPTLREIIMIVGTQQHQSTELVGSIQELGEQELIEPTVGGQWQTQPTYIILCGKLQLQSIYVISVFVENIMDIYLKDILKSYGPPQLTAIITATVTYEQKLIEIKDGIKNEILVILTVGEDFVFSIEIISGDKYGGSGLKLAVGGKSKEIKNQLLGGYYSYEVERFIILGIILLLIIIITA